MRAFGRNDDFALALTALLLEAGGFEGVRRLMKPGVPRNLSVTESPQGRLTPLDLDAAPSPACPVSQHHRHLISNSRELFRHGLAGFPAPRPRWD